MFDFFKEKEYVSCEWLEYGIHFSTDGLYHCCAYAHSDNNNSPVVPLKPDSTYDFKEFFKLKKKIRKHQKRGIIDKRCEGCFLLNKKMWTSKNYITQIAISTNTKCNSDCIYCHTHQNKKLFNSYPEIPIFDFLKLWCGKKLIPTYCKIEFGGGEPVLLSEFEDILNYLLDKNYSKIKIHSSGIKYSIAIERALSLDICTLVISPDCGDSSLYKTIKGVDKFDECWNNIKKYALAQNNNKKQVRVKYIIIPSLNDTREEIKKFIEKAEESYVKHVLVDIEMNWYKQNKCNKLEVERLFILVKYMEKLAKSKNLVCAHNSTVCCAIDDYHSLYDSTNVEL